MQFIPLPAFTVADYRLKANKTGSRLMKGRKRWQGEWVKEIDTSLERCQVHKRRLSCNRLFMTDLEGSLEVFSQRRQASVENYTSSPSNERIFTVAKILAHTK